MKERIIIATTKSWNVKSALKLSDDYTDEYEILLITNNADLNYKTISELNPKYIFFPHWSWIIPEEIYNNYECVVFHITDLPYGRGGSPLQNLIVRKIYNTKISALKVEKELDAGKIYLKKDFYIGMGSAEEIFINASSIIFSEMIPHIFDNNPVPQEQTGNPVFFKRRKPEESDMMQMDFSSVQETYDFIRMLDAEGYPKSFIKLGKYKIEFSEVHTKSDKIVGTFEVIDEK